MSSPVEIRTKIRDGGDPRVQVRVVVDRPGHSEQFLSDRYIFTAFTADATLVHFSNTVGDIGFVRKLIDDEKTTIDVEVNRQDGRGWMFHRRLKGPVEAESKDNGACPGGPVAQGSFFGELIDCANMNASAALRIRATEMRRKADEMDALARVADTLQPGSPEELALWSLAIKPT